jgi:hypothetical protein
MASLRGPWLGDRHERIGLPNGLRDGPASDFVSRKEPITSASSGDAQKASTASRGVQTIGSPRVLKEVFTSTGTPVRRSNALSRS